MFRSQKFTAFLFAGLTLASLQPNRVLSQDAFVRQIGSGNMAANIDLSGGARNVIAQVGNQNSSAQVNLSGRSNANTTVQVGNRNISQNVSSGINNVVGTVQLGDMHTAVASVSGRGNTVTTFQFGYSNRSIVDLAGSNAGVGISQTGNGLSSSLTISDSMKTSPSNGLRIGVSQTSGDPAVLASVSRDAAGNIAIRPGNATAVLKLVR